MITTKQRSFLRGLSNQIVPIFQVGKEGIEENFLKQVDQALEKRELIKIKTLNNSGITAREASDILCEELGCEGIQAIGGKLVIYRKSKKNPMIDLENLKVGTTEKVKESKKEIAIRKSETRKEERKKVYKSKLASKKGSYSRTR